MSTAWTEEYFRNSLGESYLFTKLHHGAEFRPASFYSSRETQVRGVDILVEDAAASSLIEEFYSKRFKISN